MNIGGFNMCNYFSYKRISTKEERGLQKYNRQDKALIKYAEDNNIKYTLEFKEDKSGKNFKDRTEWNKLESILQKGDTVVIKDISRFTRDSAEGYNKYMELLNKGIELIFIDNQTISTKYIKQLLNVAEQQNLVAKTSLESTIKLLLIVELDRAEQERKILINRIKNGISASDKKSGRRQGQVLKLNDELKKDIAAYLKDRSITMQSLINKHGITRNTMMKYIKLIEQESLNL